MMVTHQKTRKDQNCRIGDKKKTLETKSQSDSIKQENEIENELWGNPSGKTVKICRWSLG